MNQPAFTRPPLAEALAAWQQCLVENELPPKTLWIFSENLCIEQSKAVPGGYHFGFQTRFTPPDAEDLEIAYEVFSALPDRLVFYRVGSCPRGSVCILLCDAWFEARGARDGFERIDEWGISFHPGQAGDLEEINDLGRWLHRVKRGRPFHDFDFAMSLETLGEIKTHGRQLQPYERFAQKLLDRLRRILGQ
jgi:hypothetical protein